MKANFMLQDYVMNKYTYNEKNPTPPYPAANLLID